MFVNFELLKGKKIAFYTLGCKVNQYETDGMTEILKGYGCEVVPFSELADIYIVNTCSVTNMAERKSRQIIHRAKKLNPDAILVACGCYVQAAKDKLQEDYDIDILVGNDRKKDISRIICEYLQGDGVDDNIIELDKDCSYESMEISKPEEHCRAYVKIQDGCNNFCSYCIIPYTRGRIRSRDMQEVYDELLRLAQNDTKEVVLTGINLSSYECDGKNLFDLIVKISDIEGIERIRMGSLEPRVITRENLDKIKDNPKVCPHFHLSLQSACNETLKRMNRRYTIEEYADRVELLRSYYEKPAITTDVIVGFPGETDGEFETTRENLEKINLYEMHVFKYSKREGTVAATMDNQVSDQKKEERSNVLLEMTRRHKEEYERQFAGNKLKVLVEEYVEEDRRYYIKGHTERYIAVKREYPEEFCRESLNKIIEI